MEKTIAPKIDKQKLVEMFIEAVKIKREFRQHFANGGTISEFREKKSKFSKSL
jgi:hypothetical protein